MNLMMTLDDLRLLVSIVVGESLLIWSDLW